MAEKLLRKAVVLAKAEANYGTDSVPLAADAILCGVPTHGVSGNRQVRNYVRDSLSSSGFAVGMKKQTINLECELKGPNDAVAPDTPTYLEALLAACGLVAADGTIGADEARIYTPTSVSANMKSCTIYYFLDGIKHALVGCRGNAVLEFPVDGYPTAKFAMTGFYVAPTDAAAPGGIVLPTYMPPDCVSAGLSIGAYSPTGCEKITLDLGNKIVEKKDVNSATGLSELMITGREPKVSIEIDMDTLANLNPYTIWDDGTLKALDWMFGAKGNRVAVDIPTAQMEEPAKGDKDGRGMWNLAFLLTGADDEYVIKTG